MRYMLIVLAVFVLPAIVYAVGTKKRKQRVHVRREFVALTQAEVPVEFHSANDTFHSLRCKGTGMEKCWWERVPQVGDKDFSLEKIDQWVVKMIGLGTATREKPGLMEFNQHIRVRYWRLPNGYEYTVEEGTLASLLETDSLTRQIDSLAGKHSKRPRAVIKF